MSAVDNAVEREQAAASLGDRARSVRDDLGWLDAGRPDALACVVEQAMALAQLVELLAGLIELEAKQ